ncbi:MAG: hypothetical protein Q7J78_03360, partial [Clostridiales bacterium]|nr:hypothetical protein [Clostridiales bacterium]
IIRPVENIPHNSLTFSLTCSPEPVTSRFCASTPPQKDTLSPKCTSYPSEQLMRLGMKSGELQVHFSNIKERE